MNRIGRADAPAWDAIIVAGGRASRLGGIDKTALEWHGTTLLEHAVTAVAGAVQVCVVGSAVSQRWKTDGDGRMLVVAEDPPFSGPASAIVAGLAALVPNGSPFVAVLAADLPRVGEALPRLTAELSALPADSDGIVAIDGTGRPQTLLAVYRASSLRRAALTADPAHLAVRSLVGALHLTSIELADELCADVDTAADAAALGIGLTAGD